MLCVNAWEGVQNHRACGIDLPEPHRNESPILRIPPNHRLGVGGADRLILPAPAEWATGPQRDNDGARLVGGADAGTLVGTSTLGDFDETNEHTHIGWTAWDPRTWGTAVNPEAKLLMLTEAFEHGFGRV